MSEAVHPGPLARHGPLVHHFADLEQQKEAASLGMWVFLVTEILFFGGLFTVYAIYRSMYFEPFSAGSHHLSWQLGALNTIVLIFSSLTMALAVHAAAVGHRAAIVGYLLATIALGGVFLGVKYFEYHEKIAPCLGDPHGPIQRPYEGCLVPGPRFDAGELHLEGERGRAAQLYFSLYFAMTGLHATHMVIGIPIIGLVAWAALRGRYTPAWHTPVELLGLYWHFVDIVWIFLFPLLYLIGHH